MLYRWLVCSYISDLSNNRPPQLCCQRDGKAPEAHLVCVLDSRLGEGSSKAVEQEHSVPDPSGAAGARGSASRAVSWLAGKAGTEQSYMQSRGRVRDSVLICLLMLLFTWLRDKCILCHVQQGVSPLCLLSGLAQLKPVSTTTVVSELILSSGQCQSVRFKPLLPRPGISGHLLYNRRAVANLIRSQHEACMTYNPSIKLPKR